MHIYIVNPDEPPYTSMSPYILRPNVVLSYSLRVRRPPCPRVAVTSLRTCLSLSVLSSVSLCTVYCSPSASGCACCVSRSRNSRCLVSPSMACACVREVGLRELCGGGAILGCRCRIPACAVFTFLLFIQYKKFRTQVVILGVYVPYIVIR